MKIKTCAVIMGLFLLSGILCAYPSSPPQPLHKVGDHWTPYNPPEEFSEGTEVYIILPGDTLWNLAEQKLGSPFLWPQIWENNTYITDAHWIYPGDPLVISPGKVEEVVPEEVYEEQPPVTEEPDTPEGAVGEYTITKPVPLGSQSDMECFFKVTTGNITYPLVISGTDDGSMKLTLTEGHIAYVDGGSEEGVQAGDIYSIAEDVGILKNDSGTELGHAWLLHGKLVILCAQEHTSTARITVACDSILRGYHLIPYELVPIPTNIPISFDTVCVEPTGKVRGKLLRAKDDAISMAQGDNILITLGKADGLEAGQYLRVFRNLEAEGNDYVLLGRVAVLQVFDHISSCKIIESVRELHIGDGIELE